MSNYLRIGDCKLPTAAYAKSLNLSPQEKKNLLQHFEKALHENQASNHQWKRFKIEKGRYNRTLRKGREEQPQAAETFFQYALSFFETPAMPYWFSMTPLG